MFMISVRFPYALTSQAAQPEMGFSALDAFEDLSETDIHLVVIRHSLLKLLDMWSIRATKTVKLKAPALKLHMQA